ncbi:hypothetical protein RVR_2978 [Actinacidiphila reveromycinica]|uniref:VWA domain containing CoxE-like protein n=1 Tax=Actinacidiphila reveromycinica TaxID=659352 RepID=A0A7U3VN61_9ACTN|nr:hypothetical protein RVR_2978 [Streptomyces sp. SN-593]
MAGGGGTSAATGGAEGAGEGRAPHDDPGRGLGTGGGPDAHGATRTGDGLGTGGGLGTGDGPAGDRRLGRSEVEAESAALAGCREPYLIGVRHHSPALAAAVPELLAEAAPDVLFVELPEEFGRWLPHLADPEVLPPVALAGHGPRGLVFLPFAEFSPELAALRWARAAGVPVVAFDLPVGAPEEDGPRRGGGGAGTHGRPDRPGLADAMRDRAGGRAEDDLWDRLVESAAPGGSPEALRRAALLVGWALRHDAAAEDRLDPHDLRREAHMRRVMAEHGAVRPAALVGAFHAPALLPAASGAPGRPAVGADLVSAPRAGSGAAPEPGTAPSDRPGPVPDSDTGTGSGSGSGADRARRDRAGGGGGAGETAVTTSLVPYTFALLDERSGYPAGIRDPQWQQGVVEAAGDPRRLDELLVATAVRICAAVRAAGHPCGPPDARETVRHARDLATLRGRPAAGRAELLEAAQTVLTQGQLLGRGRVVAQALESVLVGTRHGRLAPGTPRSGLGPAVEALLAELRLPAPGSPEQREVRLDPHRSPLDRRREVALRRLAVCRVPYGEVVRGGGTPLGPPGSSTAPGPAGGGSGAAETGEGTIGVRWTVGWTPATAAMLDAVAAHGSDLAQAAAGLLRQRSLAERRRGGPTAAEVLAGFEEAALCGLPDAAADRLAETADVLPATGTLPELLAGTRLLDRVAAGLLPGLPDGWEQARIADALAALTTAGVRALDGLAGSDDPDDARALAELATRGGSPGLRVRDALTRLAAEGSPLIRGASAATRVLVDDMTPAAFGTALAARTHGATSPELRLDLGAFLAGALTAAGPLLESGPLLAPVAELVAELPDRAFLTRLPALRHGFDALSPAARGRLLAAVRAHPSAPGARGSAVPDPHALARHTAADLAGREVLAARGLLGVLDEEGAAAASAPGHEGAAPPSPEPHATASPAGTEPGTPAVPAAAPTPAAAPAPAPDGISADVRWQLLLGQVEDAGAGRAGRIATALDELYGSGHGEGAASVPHTSGGGQEPPYPDIRSWGEELADLFGADVREEVLSAAATAGRLDAALAIDPASARPSVDLLRTVLSYAGGLPEGRLARLRPLVARIVAELTRALAVRMRPALTGLTHPRPTRRPGGPLDLARTLRANLATAERDPVTGAVGVRPERPVFRTRARASADWRIVLVVDVSGSMEASTVWAALTAAVLAGVPALTTHFVAFSTEVLDLTDHVADPLSLLLEVRVGGGTSIARGLRHARTLVTVPSRTLVVLVSDFEEGGPVGPLLTEVRALVDAGCRVLGCASLDDAGRPRYSTGVAGQLVGAGMPVAALGPLQLASWIGEQVRAR